MKLELTPTEVATALVEDSPGDVMVFLATLASLDAAKRLTDAAASRHNGLPVHQAVAPWLRALAEALEAVEARDAAIDAAGRVS
jgi:hypothetical protein